jgi:hypothetical protein
MPLLLLRLSYFGSILDFNPLRAKLARLPITKPPSTNKVAVFWLAINDFVILLRPVNNEIMIKHWAFYSQHRRWHSIGMSLFVHSLLAVFVILLWSFSPDQDSSLDLKLRRASIVLAIHDDLNQPEYLSEAESFATLSNANKPPESAAASPNQPPPMDNTADTKPNSPGFSAPESLVFDASQMANVPVDSQSKLEFEFSAADIELIESDRRLLKSRAPIGNPATIGVFGSGQLTGREFVFVLDRSQSMGSGGLGVIQASRTELTTAINQLEPHHKFQIVAYHNRTSTLLKRELLPATDSNKQAVPEFIDKLSAYGGTNHENGLIAALAFQPDVIVLMTDGGYPVLHDGKLKMIRRLAGSRVQIHCIQFGAGTLQKKRNFMTRLAEQNDGSFRYIDVNQWDKSP